MTGPRLHIRSVTKPKPRQGTVLVLLEGIAEAVGFNHQYPVPWASPVHSQEISTSRVSHTWSLLPGQNQRKLQLLQEQSLIWAKPYSLPTLSRRWEILSL
jgi:hypothetical protein